MLKSFNHFGILAFHKKIHHLMEGDLFPYISKEKIDITNEQNVISASTRFVLGIPRSQQYQMIKAHAILMLFGWWTFVATAMLIARFGKPLFANKLVFGTLLWFQVIKQIFRNLALKLFW